MRKTRKLTTKLAAFSMATAMLVGGSFGDYSVASKKTTALAATTTVTATKNADDFTWDNATVYFLLTDRFKNGNTSNDNAYGRKDAASKMSDQRATFHGGDFAGITQMINEGYFDDLGVNAIWLSAPYEQIHGYIQGGAGFYHQSYHGYYVLDYTETDAAFGTKEEFKQLVDTAHSHGIRIIMDIVMNHAGYSSIGDMSEFGYGTLLKGWDTFYNQATEKLYDDYHTYVDYDNNSSDWANWWGGDWVRSGVAGYPDAGKGGTAYTKSLEGLPDFKTESTKTVGIPKILETKWKKEGTYSQKVSKYGSSGTVRSYLCEWLSEWVETYGVDGFRCDTAKHVENESWAALKTSCEQALKTWRKNNPSAPGADWDEDFWMTGEAWDKGLEYDEYYTQGKFDSMINFDMCGGGNLSLDKVSGKYDDYAGALNTNDKYNALSFISSHDEVLARGNSIYIGSAFLLLPGGVQIFYGDETDREMVSGVSFDGYGAAGHSLRSDMNWDTMNEETLAHWQKVGTFRNNHAAVGAGANTTVTASSGVAFVRTYAKGDVTDRVAACIGASANTDVTIDVSAAWKAGDTVVNYYDSSSAIVATDGTVTFNSGANGTILIADPDGKPLVTVTAAAKFKGTTTAKITIKDADYAIVSVDGAQKFKAYNGDTFTIGKTAYEGDTVSVVCKAINEKGTTNAKSTFYKAYEDEEIGGGDVPPVDTTAKIHIKTEDGSTPYVYAWTGTSTAMAGAWPGTKMTEKDSEGYYTMTFSDVKSKYNLVISNGSGVKTSDIKNMYGEVYITVKSGYGTYEATGDLISGGSDLVDNTITIHVKPYGSTAPNLHVWTDSAALNGGFPGKQLTEKDSEGYYVFTVSGYSSVSCIVSNGSNQSQSGNITGITGEAWITMTAADNSTYDIVKKDKVESKYSLMKQAARSIKNLTASDYTSATYNALYKFVSSADKLVAQGEKEADVDAVETMYNNIVAAKAALVLAAPKLTYAKVGAKTISGKAACESTVTVTIGSKTYTAKADEVTGVWSVTAATNLTSSTVIKYSCTRDSLKGTSASYSMSNGDVLGGGSDDDTKGWKQVGSSWYYYVNGKAVTGWQKISNVWYYFNASGVMQKGWVKVNSSWYYLNNSGAMQTGWIKINTSWYYLNNSGAMQTGWIKINTSWYYLNSYGVMQTGWTKVNNVWYYLGTSGVMQTGWVKISDKWYYLNNSGAMQTGWVKISNKWYYLDPSTGVMQTSKWISGIYYVKANGTMAVSEWVDGGKYYVGADGKYVAGAKK